MPVRDPFYSTRRWREFRLRILDRDGWLCQIRDSCCVVQADCVDHIIARVIAPDLSMDPSNARAACTPCNSAAGGRIGNRRRVVVARRVEANGYGDW